MRATLLAVMALSVVSVTPVLAAKNHSEQAPSWNECYTLGFDRGVHIEIGEMPAWVAECQAGHIPFENADRPQSHPAKSVN
jgi:hypothetical protein